MRERVWEEISYDRLKHNLEQIKKLINGKKIICMVKDNAYGHGSIKLSEVLVKDDSVIAFAVACMSEAIELKNANIGKDIIIIGHINEVLYKEAIEKDFIITISTYEQAKLISEVAKNISRTARIDIGIDTGMGRIGFLANEETVNKIKKISELKNISIYGLFSHFSVADCSKADSLNIEYTNMQEKKYYEIINKIKALGIKFKDVSISNSAGVLSKRGEFCSSVRPGIILYGILPSKEFIGFNFKPIMSLKSKIIYIKEIDKDTSISYGRSFVSKEKMRIATISCGYGDGYPRTASNKAEVIINDKKCKMVGKITMDMLMVDVTDVECKINDDVILIGESENEKVTLQDLCDLTGEFTYEILTRINSRVERVYIDTIN